VVCPENRADHVSLSQRFHRSSLRDARAGGRDPSTELRVAVSLSNGERAPKAPQRGCRVGGPAARARGGVSRDKGSSPSTPGPRRAFSSAVGWLEWAGRGQSRTRPDTGRQRAPVKALRPPAKRATFSCYGASLPHAHDDFVVFVIFVVPFSMSHELPVRVGVIGAGAWARSAHLPGYRRDPRCRVVAVADTLADRARDAAREFDIPLALADGHELIRRDDIDLVDVCTPSHTHFELSWHALEAGRHVLCEKPVAYDFRDTRRAADLACRHGLKTKVGLTFRYSPAMRYMRELVAGGFAGTPFIFNGYEQNSQWLDPSTPM